MEALNEALLEPANNGARDDDGAAPVRLEWAGVGVVAGRKRRVILSEAAGVAKAGRTLALLGPSGAGKTTLLRCLAGRAAPDAGSVRLVVSGGSTRAARAVFVEQEDVFCPELTAREHLRFRAGLALWRRDRTRAANGRAADARAAELLETFGLETVADHPRVGAPADARALGGARGLSGGERKRLAVALEVVGAPRLVFADEPTSGLDSQLAASVVRTLAKLARGGAIVVFSIHQPSQRCFDLCDDLVVLAHGKTLYTGRAANAVTQLAPPPEIMTLPPAEAILEVAARNAPTAAPALVKAPRRFTTARAPAPSAPFYARALALAHRGVVTQLRRWPLIVAQFATCAVFASLIGMLYEGDGVPRIDQKGVENVNGYLFMLCTGTLFSYWRGVLRPSTSHRWRRGVTRRSPTPSPRYARIAQVALPAAAALFQRPRSRAPRGGVGRLRPAPLGPRHAARGCRAAAGPPVRLRKRDVPAHRPAPRPRTEARRVLTCRPGRRVRGRVARLLDRVPVAG
jgi:ABC-type multidrug transport system ATPase subunit